MKQILKEEELSGKIIQRISTFENKTFIFLKDNMFCVFEYDDEWGEMRFCDWEIIQDIERLLYKDEWVDIVMLYDTGLISRKKFDEAAIKRDIMRNEAREQIEKEELLKLKKKYPNV